MLNAFTLTPPEPTTLLTVTAPDGRTLLAIKPDGTVVGDVADASEAGRVFVEAVGARMPGMSTETLAQAVLEAVEDDALIERVARGTGGPGPLCHSQPDHYHPECVTDVRYVLAAFAAALGQPHAPN